MLAREIAYVSYFPSYELSLDVRLFWNRVHDLIIANPTVFPFDYVNQGYANIRGVEDQSNWKLSRELRLNLAYAYTTITSDDPFGIHFSDSNPKHIADGFLTYHCNDWWQSSVGCGDAQRLTEIVGNLVSNAIKFTYRGEVSVAAQRRDAAPGKIGLRLTVRDTGIGIAPEDPPTLFEAFNQIDASTTRQQGGTGLGLAICQQLVALMRGQITVESQAGVGTAFRVTLDFQTPEQQELNLTQDEAAAVTKELTSGGEKQERNTVSRSGAAAAASHRQPLTGGAAQPGPRVLVVDDQELNQLLAQLVLEDLDAVVDLASNGWEALAACQRSRYDLILMDVRLPGMDGLATTRAIRQLVGNPNQRIPVIALTADILHETPEALRAAGSCRGSNGP